MINIEYETFPNFYKYINQKKVLVICDINTFPIYQKIKNDLYNNALLVKEICFQSKQLIPDEIAIDEILKEGKGVDYILAVGSGTLNDLAKYCSTTLNIESGVFASAPSMDGYASKGSALMINEQKVTYPVNMPHDFLIDLEVLKNAPKDMIASGFGDIIGKYTCLTDWKLSNIINNESIDKEAYKQMESALFEVVDNYEDIASYNEKGIKSLTDALVIAGLSMAKCGNSRPASGSEHHQSHFLEMYFVKIKQPIPLHGFKVALGCLISLELYNHLKETKIEIKNKDKIIKLLDYLPKIDDVIAMLNRIGCPTRFSLLNISKETFIDMIYNAYKVRDRYTILTLYNQYKLLDEIIDKLIENYY